MNRTVRLSLDVSRKQHLAVAKLAAELDCTQKEVLRRGVELVEIFARARREGRRVGIAGDGTSLAVEYVGLG